MPILVMSSREEGSQSLYEKNQTASGEKIFGSNNQTQAKWSSLHFMNCH